VIILANFNLHTNWHALTAW